MLFSKAPTARQLAIRLLLSRKGRWLEAGLRATSTTQANNTGAKTNEVMERLHSLRGQLVLRLLGKNTTTGNRDDNSIISTLQTEIDELERKLVAASGQSHRPLVQMCIRDRPGSGRDGRNQIERSPDFSLGTGDLTAPSRRA